MPVGVRVFFGINNGPHPIAQCFSIYHCSTSLCPPIFTKIYETIPNGIYNDTIDGLTTELFVQYGYTVTVTVDEVLFD
jgi:hypothetical protein